MKWNTYRERLLLETTEELESAREIVDAARYSREQKKRPKNMDRSYAQTPVLLGKAASLGLCSSMLLISELGAEALGDSPKLHETAQNLVKVLGLGSLERPKLDV